ncbi:MAG: DUF4382 domain-containing protein [Euryarchaeota archaeon]|nr:DUF4382 domain-containing protein [Euryarchaeota archaeon]
MSFRKTTPVLATLLLLVTFAGCVGDDEGRVTVYVRDAATTEFSSVFITFSKVAIHQGDEGEADQSGDEPDTEGSGWETVFEGSKEIDLLAFAGADARAFLGDANLSAGTYNQIVVTVDEARGIRASDGSEVSITVTTGWVRVVRAFQVSADQTTRIILDLDLDRSLIQQGPTGGWRLNPVIGQVLVEEDASGPEGSRTGTTSGTDGTPGGGTAGTTGTGTMTTYIKDAATDEFSEIWIRFSEVTVHKAGEDGNETDNETSDDSQWVVVVDTPRTLDLLRFSDEGSKAFLGADELAAGRYTQIRINITEAWGVRASDGENVTITVAQTEAKVVRTFTVEANTTTQVVIDLDLDRSVRQQGTQGWRMTPVIGSVQVERTEDDPRGDRPEGQA